MSLARTWTSLISLRSNIAPYVEMRVTKESQILFQFAVEHNTTISWRRYLMLGNTYLTEVFVWLLLRVSGNSSIHRT